MQTLNISQTPVLDVEDHGFRIGAGYVISQLFVGASDLH